MTRRNMLTALATAALIPVARATDGYWGEHHRNPNCGRNLTKTILDLEVRTWNVTSMPDPIAAAEELYAEDMFEVLTDGSVVDRDVVFDWIRSGMLLYDFKITEVTVLPLAENSAIILYRIAYSYYDGDVPGPFSDCRITSTYAKRHGKWKNVSYQETLIV